MKLKSVTPLGASLIITFGCGIILFLENLYYGGGYLDLESATFLGNYLAADRSLPELIFDPARNDWGFYQARELSYFFDWIDARFIGWSIRHGRHHFHTLTGFLMIVLTVFAQQYGLRKIYPKLPGWIVTSVSALYVLTPCTYGNLFFRSSKYGCSLMFTIVVLLTLSLFRSGFRRRKGRTAGIAAALLTATLFDRQGAFFTAGYAGAAGFFLLLTLQRRVPLLSGRAQAVLCGIAAASLGAVLAGTLYNLWIGPELIRAFNGYTPDFSYQNIGGLPPEAIPFGARFLFGNIGCALTGLNGFPATLAGIVLAAALLLLPMAAGWKMRKKSILFAAASLAAILAGCWVAASGMVARHPSILMPSVMYGLYFLPAWSLLIPFFGTAAETARRSGWKINPAGIVLIAAIAIHLGGYLMLYRINPVIDYQRAYQEAMPAFRRALADPGYDCRRDLLPARLLYLIEYFRSSSR